ncbi:MAG: acetamidase/formamidase family protein [Candidatus Latescibacterota bacterium]
MAHHRFTPDHYHTAIGPHAPVLHVSPGDRVSTTTVDARGRDASGEQITEPGNPMTGPFYVDGAEPGDTLAVTFERLWPNRRTGWTRPVVAPHVLDPGYAHGVPGEPDLQQWDIDLEAGTVELVQPPTRLAGIRWPLRPMLGCFGVAPPRGQTISTATSSTHGGNMDYRGFCQGVTVYLPVFVPGALFQLGDGHAIQGDGEIVGTGVETSFDVTFAVGLRAGRTVGWPHAEDAEWILTVGNARPLDQGVQHATTEMLRWLQEDFGLDAASAHALLGQHVVYEVGNVFDPAYTMVCKLSKQVLEQIGARRQA